MHDKAREVDRRTVARIRAARLDEYERRLGTGHTAGDAGLMIAEIRRFREFLESLADELDVIGPTPDLSDRLRDAARAVGE